MHMLCKQKMLILDVINRFTTLVFTFAILQIGLPEFERSTARVKDFNALISELGIHCVLLCFINIPMQMITGVIYMC